MTYARARLWLGICGVGTVVAVSTLALVLGLPGKLLPTNERWALGDLASLSSLAGLYMLLLVPFDYLGGYALPKRFGKSRMPLRSFCGAWSRGVTVQFLTYVSITILILACGRLFGVLGCVGLVFSAFVTFLASQNVMFWLVSGRKTADTGFDFEKVESHLAKWRILPLPVRVATNEDPGFTGGVVGLPYAESVVVGDSWLSRLSSEELAAVVARRCIAVSSGARTRGLALAVTWILVGFAGSTLLPSAGVTSVAGLVTTLSGFTLWTFVGLLVLPTVSRHAAHAIDDLAVCHGVSESLLRSALRKLDREQDDEASRPAIVEAIFHPVPSLTKRRSRPIAGRQAAWHTARMTLVLSWCCAGLLSRAVHCNVGRPELWIMLPTD